MKTKTSTGFSLPKYSCRKCFSPEHYAKEKGNHIGLYCLHCDAWITWISKDTGDYEMWFGKYKGKKLREIETKELAEYYNYMKKLGLRGSKAKCLNKIRTYLETKNVHFS